MNADTELDELLASDDALKASDALTGECLCPGQLFDGYRVVAFLGKGATSEVWRVRDLKDNRDYALKIFVDRGGEHANARLRFVQEARILQEFRHPNIIRVYDVHESGEHPYFTMDALRPIPDAPGDLLMPKLLDGILNGLEALHSKGIFHRDLKPSNVLLDAKNNAVLSDLGAAHIESPELIRRIQTTMERNMTMAGGAKFIGTPDFAAPEQLTGEEVSAATDIHALGVMIDRIYHDRMSWQWKVLIPKMTCTMPRYRLDSVKKVRRWIWILGLDVRQTIKWIVINTVIWSLVLLTKCCG